MLNRRHILAASVAPLVRYRQSTPKQLETRRFVAQAAHLTVDIPAHWSHTPPLPFGYTTVGAADGCFTAMVTTSRDLADTSVRARYGLPDITESIRGAAGGIEGERYEMQGTTDSSSWAAIVLPNPNPILTHAGESDRLVLVADPDHADQIFSSARFGLDAVPPSEIAHSILDLISTHSWYREQIDWSEIATYADQIPTSGEIDGFLRYRVLEELRHVGDNHSFLRQLNGEVNAATPTINGQQPNLPSGHRIDEFGYLNFPGHNSFAPDYAREYAAIAARIRNTLRDDGVKGWIIDLRAMSGGSVSPVLSALYPFLPDGALAGFVDSWDIETWIEKDGTHISPAAYLADLGDIEWPADLADVGVPVAVLIGAGTGSAGEFSLLALMSRSNLRTFGGRTAGYTTGNVSFPLFDSSALALAVSAEMDAEGTIYTSIIKPDSYDAAIGNGIDISDATLSRVFAWLRVARQTHDC